MESSPVNFIDTANFKMVFVLLSVLALLILYITKLISVEISSLIILTFLLLFFQFFPVLDINGSNVLSTSVLLSGFSNPALLAVISLLVLGEGIVRTGALDNLGEFLSDIQLPSTILFAIIFLLVVTLSAFLNNTPIVLIFIPILQSLASRFDFSIGRLMMPLSYSAILGGMITLVGSSTNLLISSSMLDQGLDALGIFEITPFGLVLAASAMLYILFIMPMLLPEKDIMNRRTSSGRQYISQFVVPADAPFLGEVALAGHFESFPNITIKVIFRDNKKIQVPFDNYEVRAGDIFVVAATRVALTKIATTFRGLFHPPLPYGYDFQLTRIRKHEEASKDNLDTSFNEDGTILVEAMISPSSRMIGLTLTQFELQQSQCAIFLGIQRRSTMRATRMTDMRIKSGDILLLKGKPNELEPLRNEGDIVMISGTRGSIPKRSHAKRAIAIFIATILSVSFGFVDIATASIAAATATVLSGCINFRQAARAIDKTIYLLAGTSLALGTAMTVTGGASYIANSIVFGLGLNSMSPIFVLSSFFLLVAIITNLISNHACAVLFTPIGIGLALSIGIDPRVFAITCLFACNCSFASPLGYQTNLLVMGPGHYGFMDFVRAGLPLVAFVWIVFTLIAPMYWEL